MRLEEWAKGFELGEGDPQHTARVRLLTPDEEVWHTWERSELDARWAEDAHRYLDAMAAEYPLGKQAVEFVAEDSAGAVRSRLKRTIQGKNAGAKRGAPANDIAAFTRAMESLTSQMSRYMDFQHESQQRYQTQVEALLDAHGRMANQIIEERENGIRNQSGATEILATAISNHIGPVLEELPAVMRFLTGSEPKQPRLVSVPTNKKG